MKGGEQMYPNLEAEMARKKITRVKMAKALNMTPTTLGNKLNEKTKLSLPESIKIKKILEVSMSLEELFKKE